MSIFKIIKTYPRTFWIVNTMELFERWAWYGMFVILSLYLTNSTETGALGFTQIEKGSLMGSIVGILYFMPIFTGSIADKFGYKNVLLVSFAILSTGYLMMGYFNTYWTVYFAFLYLAIGAALFKPVITATISKTTNDSNSSIGFGIFYMIVNIGAFIGPIVAMKLKVLSWDYVFIMASVVIGINFLLVLFFFKEPGREKNNDSLSKSILGSVTEIYTVLKDIKFLIFLLLITGFWSMYNQLFYTLPVYIDQWVDLQKFYSDIHSFWPWLAETVGSSKNQIIQSGMLVNMDAFYIIIFQIAISSFVMRFKALNAMIGGIFVCSIGIGLTIATANPFFMLLSLLIFAVGEMASSPKITEYIGKIAPKDKIGMYMGASFLPMAGGNWVAGYLSGDVYTRMSDKLSILKIEVAERGLRIPDVSESFSKSAYNEKVEELVGMNMHELTTFLYDKYDPSQIWIVFTSIGVTTALLLFIYDKFLLKSK